MKKVVINRCWGGFGLSHKALQRIHDLDPTLISRPIDKVYSDSKRREEDLTMWREHLKDPSKQEYYHSYCFTPDEKFVLSYVCAGLRRDNPVLVQVVEELGVEANGACARLEIEEISDCEDFYIEDNDGKEWIEIRGSGYNRHSHY